MSDTKFVICTTAEHVATVTVNRPESLNALNTETLRQLYDCFTELRDLPFNKLRTVILRGAGGKAFVAGADIKVMQSAKRDELLAFIALGQGVMRQIELLPVPVIAAVDGFALGGGLELALACDVIIATSRSKLGQPEVNLGLIPGFGGTQRLTLRVGTGGAKRLIFTGETITGPEAYRLGIIDWLTEAEDFEAKLGEVTAQFCLKSPYALAAAKRCIECIASQDKLAGLSREVDEFITLFQHKDTSEGLRAFVEKRKPNFRGEG